MRQLQKKNCISNELSKILAIFFFFFLMSLNIFYLRLTFSLWPQTCASPQCIHNIISQTVIITNRMRNDAPSSVLDTREHVTWHQAGSGAAENHASCDKILHLMEDSLLCFQVLEHTLLFTEIHRGQEQIMVYNSSIGTILNVLKCNLQQHLLHTRTKKQQEQNTRAEKMNDSGMGGKNMTWIIIKGP